MRQRGTSKRKTKSRSLQPHLGRDICAIAFAGSARGSRSLGPVPQGRGNTGVNGRGCCGPSEQLASADTRLTLRCGSISHDTLRLWTILILIPSSVSTNSCLSAFLVCTGELVGWLLTNPGKFLLPVREGAACGSLCVPTKPRSKCPFHPGGWQKFPGHKHLVQIHHAQPQWSQVPELRRAMHFHRVYFSVWKSVSCSDCSLPGSCVHGILQTRILEWVAYPFSRGSSQPRDWTQVSCIAGRFFTIWATRKLFKVPAAMFGELGLSVRRSVASLLRSFRWWQGTLILQHSVSVPPQLISSPFAPLFFSAIAVPW